MQRSDSISTTALVRTEKAKPIVGVRGKLFLHTAIASRAISGRGMQSAFGPQLYCLQKWAKILSFRSSTFNDILPISNDLRSTIYAITPTIYDLQFTINAVFPFPTVIS